MELSVLVCILAFQLINIRISNDVRELKQYTVDYVSMVEIDLCDYCMICMNNITIIVELIFFLTIFSPLNVDNYT